MLKSTTDCQPSLGRMAPENVDVVLTVLFSPITLFRVLKAGLHFFPVVIHMFAEV